jgi:hypothetical protein
MNGANAEQPKGRSMVKATAVTIARVAAQLVYRFRSAKMTALL